jgi:hypothetical protein
MKKSGGRKSLDELLFCCGNVREVDAFNTDLLLDCPFPSSTQEFTLSHFVCMSILSGILR